MRRLLRPGLIVIAALATLVVGAHSAAAQQQVNTQVPLHGVSHSFFERNGVGFSMRRPGFFLNLGGFNQAVPPFGGFQPGAGLQGGFGFGGGGFGGFSFAAGQGSRTSNVMQSGNLTMMQGQGALLQDTSQTPFVIDLGRLPWKQQMDGVIPMQQPQPRPASVTTADGPVEKPAAQPFRGGDELSRLSVAEIRRRKAAASSEKQQKAQQNYDRGREAEAKGKPAVARIYYQMAARDAEGELKQQIEQRLQSLKN